ncbi:hypothetical protein BHM03_00044710 [Ensete ventricosum]|nr:hypothetical protein BHM03_00044710 [Ensete ventricosum]
MQSGAIGLIDPLVHLFSLVSLNPKSSLYGPSLVSCWWLEAERFACRWSRIARRLPGRTDNEIKNYWRTHTRRRAQERNRSSCPSPSSSSVDPGIEKPGGGSVAGGSSLISGLGVTDEVAKGYTMDQIWNEIAASESASGLSFEEEQDCCPPMPCSMWGVAEMKRVSITRSHHFPPQFLPHGTREEPNSIVHLFPIAIKHTAAMLFHYNLDVGDVDM